MIRSTAALAAAVVVATACARHPPRSHTVEIRDFVYVPDTLEVAVGDTVVWINRDIVPHTAARVGGGWNSSSLGPEGTWRLVVEATGGQSYLCSFHPTMRGELVVR